MADLYDILESKYYDKWRAWIYKLRLEAPCKDPVNDLFDIVNSLCDINNSHRNTAIRFGCKDANGMEFFINRVGDGKIVLVEDVRDREYFHELIQRVCAMILNSNQNWSLHEGTEISVHLTSVPFEWMVQLAAHGKLR